MIIGLTGGIASGKTFCAEFFRKQNFFLIDADIIAREVVNIGSSLLDDLAKTFGADILLNNGELNRPKLRELIITDKKNLELLNNLMHPAIRKKILAELELAKNEDFILLVVPLLFENKLNELCDLTILVDIPEALQIKRGITRDNTKAENIERMIKNQMPRFKKIIKANFIIDNSKDKENTIKQCEILLTKIKDIKK